MTYLRKTFLYLAIIICHYVVTPASNLPNDITQPWNNKVSESGLKDWNSHLNQQELLKLNKAVQREKQNITESEALIAITLKKIHDGPHYEQLTITLPESQSYPWNHYVDKELLRKWRNHLNLQKLLKLKDNSRRAGRSIEQLETEISNTLKKIQAFRDSPSEPALSITHDLSPQQIISPTKTQQLLNCLNVKQNKFRSNSSTSSPKNSPEPTKSQRLLNCLKVKPKMTTTYLYPKQVQEALTSYRNIVDACCKFGIDKSLAQPTVKKALEHKDLESNDAILTSLTKILTKEETQGLMDGDQKREVVVKLLRVVDPMSSAADFADRFNR